MGTTPDAAGRRCVIYFDGSCPLCSREIGTYQGMRGADALTWLDASRCDSGALGNDLEREAALGRFHVRAADGSLVSGAAAFIEIWKHLPALALPARLCSTAPVLTVLEFFYGIFLRLRGLWRATPSAAGQHSDKQR
jgi:predicted DCC family thiol-disulfide oxidoreductase YuxK